MPFFCYQLICRYDVEDDSCVVVEAETSVKALQRMVEENIISFAQILDDNCPDDVKFYSKSAHEKIPLTNITIIQEIISTVPYRLGVDWDNGLIDVYEGGSWAGQQLTLKDIWLYMDKGSDVRHHFSQVEPLGDLSDGLTYVFVGDGTNSVDNEGIIISAKNEMQALAKFLRTGKCELYKYLENTEQPLKDVKTPPKIEWKETLDDETIYFACDEINLFFWKDGSSKAKKIKLKELYLDMRDNFDTKVKQVKIFYNFDDIEIEMDE